MDPVYYFILSIVGVFTAALTVLKITSMRKANGNSNRSTVTTRLCDDRFQSVQRDLAEGRKEFKQVRDWQSKHGQLLARMDERVTYLAEQSGYNKKGRKKQ